MCGYTAVPEEGLTCKIQWLCLSSGTHGYMAPEVLAKGVAYDSSADWFSFGCMLYKLLRGFVADLLSSVLIGLKLV